MFPGSDARFGPVEIFRMADAHPEIIWSWGAVSFLFLTLLFVVIIVISRRSFCFFASFHRGAAMEYPQRGIHWSKLTAPELSALAKDHAVVVVPIGSTEQHGPHLVTGTDHVLAAAVCE